jgi:hypothetical protein
MNSRDLLKRFASSKSKYFDLPDGEEAQVKFLYAEEVPNHFDGGETRCIRFHFEVDGKEMLWDRTSRELAKQMALIPEGATILIKRVGEKSKTKYSIRKIEE